MEPFGRTLTIWNQYHYLLVLFWPQWDREGACQEGATLVVDRRSQNCSSASWTWEVECQWSCFVCLLFVTRPCPWSSECSPECPGSGISPPRSSGEPPTATSWTCALSRTDSGRGNEAASSPQRSPCLWCPPWTSRWCWHCPRWCRRRQRSSSCCARKSSAALSDGKSAPVQSF